MFCFLFNEMKAPGIGRRAFLNGMSNVMVALLMGAKRYSGCNIKFFLKKLFLKILYNKGVKHNS
jgi:hypothetical protein